MKRKRSWSQGVLVGLITGLFAFAASMFVPNSSYREIIIALIAALGAYIGAKLADKFTRNDNE
ncbi:hypothetical protein [Virgibacillus litoralis]|uniref:Small basic protein n=1 Tax=Virgibacillus litoralis TaxID=578221 RepID=A0ABS4H8L8_9BACI|nr:hypothetical protein [Virgibacillus litoralis]MBP1947203.1 small basic protein [Virgibacillus litoralis]